MKASQRVKLTWCEARLIMFVSKARKLFNKRKRVKEQAQSKINGPEALAAEYAFCKLHNLYPDLGWHDWGAKDCVWEGWDVDVKCVKGDRLNVRWNEKKQGNDRTMMYCAMRRTSKASFEYLGFVQQAELETLGEKRPDNVGDGYYWSVPIKSLHKSWDRVISF